MLKIFFGKKVDPKKMEAKMRQEATREVKGGVYAAVFVIAAIGSIFAVASCQNQPPSASQPTHTSSGGTKLDVK